MVHVEQLGADTNVYLETENAGTLTARLFGEVRYAPDKVIWASAEPKFVYRFDANGAVLR